jgi:hypothetical protein
MREEDLELLVTIEDPGMHRKRIPSTIFSREYPRVLARSAFPNQRAASRCRYS